MTDSFTLFRQHRSKADKDNQTQIANDIWALINVFQHQFRITWQGQQDWNRDLRRAEAEIKELKSELFKLKTKGHCE